MHGYQLVYNVPTLLRLRKEVDRLLAQTWIRVTFSGWVPTR